MEIAVAREQVFQLQPQLPFGEAQRRVEEKKVQLAAGGLGSLLTRPNPAEMVITYGECRLEPFWALAVHTRAVYDRQRPATISVGGPEVTQVTLLGQTLPVDGRERGVTVTVTEHCVDEQRLSRFFTGDGAPFPDGARLVGAPRAEIADLAAFQPEGMLLVPPQMHAAAVTRQVLSEAVKPLKAQVIHEERVEIGTLELYFRPVYAFELTWAAKGKRSVIEVDGLTGEVRAGGKTLKEHLRQALNRDLLFDLSADAVGMFVPGGSLAVKLVKAAVDLKKR